MENPAFSAKVVSIIIRALIGLVLVSLLAGQVLRFPLPGQGGGVVMSDVFSALLVMVVGASVLLGAIPQKGTRTTRALLTVIPFMVWGLFVLCVRSDVLGRGNFSVALLYWIRLASILLMYPAGMAVLRNKHMQESTKRIFVYTYGGLLVLGFSQLLFFPNLAGLAGGWDPHLGRIVATWLDPNFFGAYLALGLPATLLWLRMRSEQRLRIVRALFFLVGLGAILLTKSRSTYIAACIALLLCGGIWLLSSSLSRSWRKMVIPGILTILIVLSISGIVLRERASQIFLHDPTVALRLEAYQGVWDRLVVPNIFFGVGYNAYQFAAQDAGLVSNFLIHSRSGSDSSILTLLVTTGIVGTALFLIPILIGSMWHMRRWFQTRNYNSLLFIWATVFLLVHSQFENSLLYPHLLIPYIFIALLAL